MTFNLQKAICDHLRDNTLTGNYTLVDNTSADLPFMRFGSDFGTDISNCSAQINTENITLDFYTDDALGSTVVRQMMSNIMRVMRDFTYKDDFITVSKPKMDLYNILQEENTDQKRLLYHGFIQFRFIVQYLETDSLEKQWI